MNKEAFYFGCLVRGHHLFNEKRQIIELDTIDQFPWTIYQIDTGLLESWKVMDIPDGRVHWSTGGNPLWYCFCWWDRSGDRRTQSNSGFYVFGFNPNEQKLAFQYASDKFKDVISRQKFNLNLQNMEARCFQALMPQNRQL